MSEPEAVPVIRALRKFRDDIDEIANAIDDKHWVHPPERERLQELLRGLKASLKVAAKYGTVSGRDSPQTDSERFYFAPAVQKASAYLAVRVNSHPNKSDWHSNLHSVRIDITYFLHQLEARFPDPL
jgi:hypothetical protein